MATATHKITHTARLKFKIRRMLRAASDAIETHGDFARAESNMEKAAELFEQLGRIEQMQQWVERVESRAAQCRPMKTMEAAA